MKQLVLLLWMGLVLANQAWACTVFCIGSNGRVLVGNNEDYQYREPYVLKVVPGKGSDFGRLVFSTRMFGLFSWVQGGFNEKGLCFDATATPSDGIRIPKTPGHTIPLWFNVNDDLLAKCSTVAEAVRYLSRVDFGSPPGQYLIADPSGRSVIVEWVDGSMHVIERSGDHQIATNRLKGKPNLPGSSGEKREELFEFVLKDLASLDIPGATKLLRITSSRGTTVGTRYSCLYDLAEKTVTIYVRSQFNRPMTYRLMDLLKEGPMEIDIDRIDQGQKVDSPTTKP